MKKILKWIGITAGVLVGFLVIGAIALPFVLPLEKIKELATEKISEAINREVKVAKVSFNIFEGIKLQKLTISNRPGYSKKDFVSADAITLSYAFWPIFKRQVIVKEISLVKPEILVEKGRGGEYNFGDMGKGSKQKAESSKQSTGKKKQDFSLIVDSFSIKNAKITYVDHQAGTKSEIKNANLKIAGVTLAMLKPIDFDFSATANYQGKDIPLSLAGKLELDLAKEVAKIPSLKLNIAGENAALSGHVSNWKNGPTINFTINSKKLTIDPLLAIFASDKPKVKKKAAPGELTKSINKSMAGISSKLRVKGEINIDNLKILNFGVDKALANFTLSRKNLNAEIKEIKLYEGTLSGLLNVNLATPGLSYNVKNLKLENFNAATFSNVIVETFLTRLDNHKDLLNKVYGRLSASLSLAGAGVEAPSIMANLNAQGSLALKDGELKRLKTIDAIADKINTPSLKQDLKISLLSSDFRFSNQVLDISNFDLKESDLQAKFRGSLDLKNLKYVPGNRLDLQASPNATKGLAREYDLLRNEQGWLEITLELTGDLKKPFPKPILEKPIEKAVGKVKLKIEAKKIEIEEQAKEEAQKQVDEQKEKLKEEAAKQLKNLIKF